MRFPRIVALVACLSSLNAGYAQTVVIPPVSPPGKLIPVEINGLESGDRIYLKASPGGDAKNLGLNRGIATGVPGNHTLFVIVFPKEGEPHEVAVPFAVEGDAPTPPVPVIKTLAQLAGKDAAAISSRLVALSNAVKADGVPVEAFPQALALSLAPWKDSPAIAVITTRLSKLTDLAAIAKELDLMVAELGSLPPPDDPTVPTTPATAATYVYEKDATPVPTGVSTGLNRLNRERNIRATLFEEDTVDGDGDVPDQYKVPLDEARKVGLPALVITAGETVLKVVKDPRTEQQVFEAIAP